eukprot:765208-Hanusia_phi.AAC.2
MDRVPVCAVASSAWKYELPGVQEPSAVMAGECGEPSIKITRRHADSCEVSEVSGCLGCEQGISHPASQVMTQDQEMLRWKLKDVHAETGG